MKSVVVNTILGKPVNWLCRTAERTLMSPGTPYSMRVLRLTLLTLTLYAGVAVLAIGVAALLVLADAVQYGWFL